MPLAEVGSIAPNFSLLDQAGKHRALKDYRGHIVVLYFYPEDDTPLCTNQACQFRDHHPDFSKVKAVVLGVSPQGVGSKKAFADKHALDFPILADDQPSPERPRVSTLYGVWGEKSMYGRTFVGMSRTTFLIDPNGKIVRRWDRVKTPGHAAAVLAAVRALHSGTKLDGKLPAREGKSRQRVRTQAGHAGYSGVLSTKQKNTQSRSMATKASAQSRRVRGVR
jgi:peroxiredoxin Q/BCP